MTDTGLSSAVFGMVLGVCQSLTFRFEPPVWYMWIVISVVAMLIAAAAWLMVQRFFPFFLMQFLIPILAYNALSGLGMVWVRAALMTKPTTIG